MGLQRCQNGPHGGCVRTDQAQRQGDEMVGARRNRRQIEGFHYRDSRPVQPVVVVQGFAVDGVHGRHIDSKEHDPVLAEVLYGFGVDNRYRGRERLPEHPRIRAQQNAFRRWRSNVVGVDARMSTDVDDLRGSDERMQRKGSHIGVGFGEVAWRIHVGPGVQAHGHGTDAYRAPRGRFQPVGSISGPDRDAIADRPCDVELHASLYR